MNENILKGSWKELKGKVQAKWGELTDDELDIVNGNRQKLSGLIQKKYGVAEEQVNEEIKHLEKSDAA